MTSSKNNPSCLRLHFTVVVLLLYEGLSVVTAVPVVVSGGVAPQSPSTLQYQDKFIAMPIWARKAGGNWRPELFQELSRDSFAIGSPEYETGQSENTISGMGSDMKKRIVVDEILPATVSGNLHQAESEEKRVAEGESTQEKDDDYEYEYEEIQPEEQECPEDKFWHIRGLKCVPYDCPGGNTWRDRDTGDCILKYYGYRNRWRSRPWRP